MKKQSLVRILILAVILSAGFIVYASSRIKATEGNMKEECTEEKCSDKKVQNEFILETLTHNLLCR